MRYATFKIVLFSIFISTNSLKPMQYVQSLQTRVSKNRYSPILLAIPFLCIQKIAEAKASKELSCVKKFFYASQKIEDLKKQINQQVALPPSLTELILIYQTRFRCQAKLQLISNKMRENSSINSRLLDEQVRLEEQCKAQQEIIQTCIKELSNLPSFNELQLEAYQKVYEELEEAHKEQNDQLLRCCTAPFIVMGAMIGYGVARFCIAKFLKKPIHYLEIPTTWKLWITQKTAFFIIPLIVSQCVDAASKFQQRFPQLHIPALQIILSSIASYVATIRLNNYFYIEILPFTTEEHVLTCLGQNVLPSICSIIAT